MPALSLKAPSSEALHIVAGWLAVLLPLGLISGRAGTEFVLVPFGVLFLLNSWVQRDFSWLRNRWIQVILALWLYLVIRTILAGAPLRVIAETLATARFGTAAVALSLWILPDVIWRQRLAVSASLCCAFLAIDALFQFQTGHDFFGQPRMDERLTGTFSFPRVGAMLAWLTLPGVLGLYEMGWKRSALGILVVAYTATVLSGERAAFIIFTTSAAIAILFLVPSRTFAIRTLAAGSALLLTLLVAFPKIYQRQVHSTVTSVMNVDGTHYGIIWQRTLDMASTRPLTGFGMGMYKTTCPSPKFGPERTHLPGLTSCANHPHNIYLEWLVDGGLIGLGLFSAFLVLIGQQLWARRTFFGTNPVFTGLVILLIWRILPVNTSTEFFRAWGAVPFWLHIGWALALAADPTLRFTDAAKSPKAPGAGPV